MVEYAFGYFLSVQAVEPNMPDSKPLPRTLHGPILLTNKTNSHCPLRGITASRLSLQKPVLVYLPNNHVLKRRQQTNALIPPLQSSHPKSQLPSHSQSVSLGFPCSMRVVLKCRLERGIGSRIRKIVRGSIETRHARWCDDYDRRPGRR